MAAELPPLLPAPADGLADGPFRYPHDFEWTPRLAVSRTGVGRFRLDTPVATLRPGGRVREAHVDRLRGDDKAGDGSPLRPFRTIARAWSIDDADADTIDIVVAAASLPASRILWGAEGQCPEYLTRVARPLDIVLRASDGERFYIAACGQPQPDARHSAPPVWTVRRGQPGADAVYTTPVDAAASPLAMPFDLSPAARAANGGRPLAARRATDALDTGSRPGSAFVDPAGGLLWFRPFDDRSLVGDPSVTAGSLGPGKAFALNVSLGRDATRSKTVFLHRVTVIGGSAGIRGGNQSDGRARVTVVLDEAEAFGQAENAIQFNGGFDVYAVGGAYGGAAADALNVHAAGAGQAGVEVMQTRIFAYGVHAADLCGLAGDGRNNSATLHEWCQGAYFACRFGQSDGRVVGFIENSRGVVAGCTIGGSVAADSGGYRTMVSVSGTAVMDLIECTILPQPPGARSPSIRAEPGARLRLHGLRKRAFLDAGLALSSPDQIVEENAGSTLHPTAGPLRVYNRVVRRGGTTRLYVRGVWNDAPWSATLPSGWNGSTVTGCDADGRYVDVTVALLAPMAPVLRLEHAPPGVPPWRGEIVLDAPLLTDADRYGC